MLRNLFRLAKIITISSLWLSCEKVVDIKDLSPKEVAHCQLMPELEGRWISDSVHVLTTVDTIDSAIINKQPTMTYILDLECSSRPLFQLWYINFAGVVTDDVRSTNYTSNESAFFIFTQLDSLRDTTHAGFRLSYWQITDSTLLAQYSKQSNPHQQTNYKLFLRLEAQ